MSNIAFVDCLTSPKRITPPERIALPERLALRDALSALTQNGLELNSREGGEHGVLKQREIADERAGLDVYKRQSLELTLQTSRGRGNTPRIGVSFC